MGRTTACLVVQIVVVLFMQSAAWSAPIQIEFWHSMAGVKGKLLADIVKKFNEASANQGKIEVHAQFVGSYDEGLNKLRTAVLAGSEPHIVQITDIGAKVMIDSGRITPLADLIDRDPSFPLSELLPPLRHYYEYAGRLQALPFASSNPVLYFNQDAFKTAGIGHPPASFADLEADAKLLTNSGLHIVGLTWPLHSWFFEEFIARQGATLFNNGNGRDRAASESHYTSPEALAFVKLWSKMVKDGTFGNVGRGWDPAEQNFLAGRARMLITSTSDVFELLEQAPFALGVAAIPGPDFDSAAQSRGGTIVGGNSLWLMKNKSAKEQTAAFEFIKFMASAETQENWHTHTGYFPIRRDVIETLKAKGFYKKYPAAWIAIEQMQNSPDNPATRGALLGAFPEAREHLMTAIEEILSDRMEIHAALAKAEEKSNHSLMRYNKGLETDSTP